MKMDEDYLESKCIMLDHNTTKNGMCPACTFFKDCRKKDHVIIESGGVHVCAKDFLKSMTAFDVNEGEDGSTITINKIIDEFDSFPLTVEDGKSVAYHVTKETLAEHELIKFEFDTMSQKLAIKLKALDKYRDDLK